MSYRCKILKKNARIRKNSLLPRKHVARTRKPRPPLPPYLCGRKKLKTILPKTNEMKNQNMKLWAALALGAVCALPAQAQKQKAAVKDTVATVQHGASNMMLNASSESEPRFINVGLPEATGGTVVTENGLSVTYDTYTLRTNQAWRQDGSFAGFLRYGLFWDSIPFMNLLFLLEEYRNQGIGTALVAFWEDRMRKEGFSRVMTSTQSDESAQHFYRKLGYMDTGALVLPEQPMEIILRKEL